MGLMDYQNEVDYQRQMDEAAKEYEKCGEYTCSICRKWAPLKDNRCSSCNIEKLWRRGN